MNPLANSSAMERLFPSLPVTRRKHIVRLNDGWHQVGYVSTAGDFVLQGAWATLDTATQHAAILNEAAAAKPRRWLGDAA